MKKLSNKSMSEVQGGCEVNYTFNGNGADFTEVLQELESMDNGAGQLALLTSLYNSGCIQLTQ